MFHLVHLKDKPLFSDHRYDKRGNSTLHSATVMSVCVCLCVRACVRACVHVCVVYDGCNMKDNIFHAYVDGCNTHFYIG